MDTRRDRKFDSNIVKTDGCWIWEGAARGEGYGRFSYKYKHYRAHRYIFARDVLGIDPDELKASVTIYHTCGCRNCVNPLHLTLDPSLRTKSKVSTDY